jgi:hypothetical protein
MTRASLCAVIACALTSACSNLPDVTANSCGNGVVEPGEECDGDASAAGGTCGTTGDNACHFVCDNGATCPTGYACGADKRCRAPSATFYAAPGPYPFDATDLAAGDVDGDGTADLVGVSASALTARFGNSDADLFQSASQPITTPAARAVFGDLNADGHMDVIVPNAVGVFAFLADGQGFNPYPYTSIALPDQTSPVRMQDVEVIPDPFSEMLAFIGKDMSYINAKAQYTVCIDGGIPPLCAASVHDASKLLAGPIPTGKTGYEFGAVVTPDKDFTDEFVLAFQDADHVDLWSPTLPVVDGQGNVDETTLSVQKIETLQLPVAGTLGTQVRIAKDGVAAFGHFDLDTCIDLLLPVSRVDANGQFEGIAIAYGSKIGSVCTGKLDAPVLVSEAQLDPGGTTKGLIPRAVVDLDGDGVSDLVTNELIAVTSCTRDRTGCAHGQNNVFALDFRSFTPRTWTAAVATDVNHDGVADIAGIVAGQDDVDVMIGAGFGFTNRFQVATSLPARNVRTGDFDGDLFDDVAVIVGDTTDASTEDDHLVVAYGGAAGGPSAAVDMGSFGIVQVMEPVSLFTDLQSIDLITDAIIIADRGTRRGVAPLIGSSTRRLLAPYLLGEGPATAQQRDTPVAIQLGQFDGDAQGLPDVAALAHLVQQQSPTGGTVGTVDLSPRIFLLEGQGGGDLVGLDPEKPAFTTAQFEYRDALWASGRLSKSDPTDTIIGIDATDDRQHEAQAISPHWFMARPPVGGGNGTGNDWAVVPPTALPSPYNAMRVHAVSLADLDADGAPDLIVEMTGAVNTAGPGAQNTTTTAIFVAFDHGGAFDAGSLVAVTPSGASCRGSAPVQADLDAPKELATICTNPDGSESLEIFDWDGAKWSVAHTVTVTGASPRVVVGDFNGDTLDDLAIVSGAGATATAQVYAQCALGDVACAAKALAQLQTGGK